MIDFDHLLFNIEFDSRTPAPGALLVAEPFLRDAYFQHAVICLIEYAPSSTAMGIVMNHPTAYSLAHLISSIDPVLEIPVFCGGPLSCDRLYYMHTLGTEIIPDSRKIKQGLYIGGDFNAMTHYVNSGYPTEGCIRFFVGYSGWSQCQLDQELNEHTWAVADFDTPESLLTGRGDKYWHRKVRTLGSDFRGWRYHPQNPQAN